MEVVTVQELRVRAGCTGTFVARFRELDVLSLAADAAEGELLEAVMAVDDDAVVVVTRWASSSGIEAWLASAARARVHGELEQYYAEPPVVRRFSPQAWFEAVPASEVA